MKQSLKELKINNDDIYLLIKDIINIAKFILQDSKNIYNELDNIKEKMS